ncbi:hypothetical protein [uncultured Roseibium sp.]|uniref:hypothetical protein n=1 Tax=uncultured Roseibium sp. TaxID=1936171 RepID=UPI00262070E4|nr:hypothetical protein [uncultured Roseibium sp.]
MSGLKDEIEAARERVAHYRLRAERPSARLEDEYALEKARTRLLTLELRGLKAALKSKDAGKSVSFDHESGAKRSGTGHISAEAGRRIRTKHEHLGLSSRAQAEASFAALQKGPPKPGEGR